MATPPQPGPRPTPAQPFWPADLIDVSTRAQAPSGRPAPPNAAPPFDQDFPSEVGAGADAPRQAAPPRRGATRPQTGPAPAPTAPPRTPPGAEPTGIGPDRRYPLVGSPVAPPGDSETRPIHPNSGTEPLAVQPPPDRSHRRALLLEMAEAGRGLEADAIESLPSRSVIQTPSAGVGRGRRAPDRRAPDRRRRPLKALGQRPLLLAGGVLLVVGLGATATAASTADDDGSSAPSTTAAPAREADAEVAANPTIPTPATDAGAAPSTDPPPITEPPPVTAPPPVTEEPGPDGPTTEAPPPREPVPSEPAPPPTAPPDWKPMAIRVPALEVDAPVDVMGVDAENALEVPSDPVRVGWWSGGAQPGQPDPAVLVGHLDSSTGPAVFFGLEKLKPGDVIEVDRADATTARFAVQRIESHPKTEFPTLSVYGGTEDATLRLITCFGEFDPVARSYQNNLVVYANLLP